MTVTDVTESLYIIPGTPETLSSDLPEYYETDRLRILPDTTPDLRREDWIPECPELFYDVHLKDGTPIGDVSVFYDYESKLMQVGSVNIYDDFKNKGYGIEIYASIPSMRLPDGKTFDESGFAFVTEYHSDEAERVWSSFERHQLAVNVGKSAYWWIGHNPSNS